MPASSVPAAPPITGLTAESLDSLGAALIAAFDHVSDVYVFVKDDHRRFIGCNESFAHMLGYPTPRHLLGLRDEDVSPEYLADHYRSHDDHILSTGEQLVDLVELVRNSDGTCDWFLTTKTPIKASGHTTGLVGVTRALTKRNAVTERLLSLTPAVELISKNYERAITIAEMAATVSMSTSYFSRMFKSHFGSSPYQYLRRIRIMAVCDLLSTTDISLSVIAAQTGFYDQSHLSNEFRRERGMAPVIYRRRYHGVAAQRLARMTMPRT